MISYDKGRRMTESLCKGSRSNLMELIAATECEEVHFQAMCSYSYRS